MIAVAPALILADVTVVGSLTAAAMAEVDHSLVAQAALLQGSINDSNGQYSFGPSGGGTGPLTVTASIVEGGRVMAVSGRDPLPASALSGLAVQASTPGSSVFGSVVDAHGDAQRGYAVSLGPSEQGGPANPVLVVSRSVSALRAAQRQTVALAALLSTLTLVLTGLIARWLAGRVLRPVRIIARLARTISERDLQRRVDLVVPGDELGELVATFNDMLARLEREFEALRRFTADASHELRAPLSIMRGELELSLGRERAPADYRRSQRLLLGEVQHLAQIAERLLVPARSDAGTLQADRSEVDINDLLTEAVERWQPHARRRRIHITAECPDWGTASADPVLLRQVLDNLMDNALRHAPAASDVALRARRRDGGWEIDVSDQGPGVPAALRGRLFDRFFRVDGARTREAAAGAGLGLAVSSAIARAHGGDLSYVDTPTGALFRLRLPANQTVDAT